MDRKKSAKDIAFDKERSKLKQEIKRLEGIISEKDKMISQYADGKFKAEAKIEAYEDWIRRLLEYTNMTEDDMRKMIDHDRNMAELTERLNQSLKFFSPYIF